MGNRQTFLIGLVAGLAAGALAAAFILARPGAAPRPRFHDMRVNHVQDLLALVDPKDPAVRELAGKLGTPEAAYSFVRDRVRFKPMSLAVRPADVVRAGAASCLGKAALLCSLYRAMGMPPSDVRIITGSVAASGQLADHAWIDLEYRGSCMQQDPSGLLGTFGFADFPGLAYTHTFVAEEDYCFNDAGLAIVSQLNRFRDTGSAP